MGTVERHIRQVRWQDQCVLPSQVGIAIKIVRDVGHIIGALQTYQVDGVVEGGVGRKCGKNWNSTPDGSHNSRLFSDITESRSLVFHKGGNSFNRVAALQLHGEWMYG
jgi:hypothetical protein